MVVICWLFIKLYESYHQCFIQTLVFFPNIVAYHIMIDLWKLHKELRELYLLVCREKVLSGNIEVLVSLAEPLLFGIMNSTAVAVPYSLLRLLQNSIVMIFVFLRFETSLAELYLKFILFECIISTSFATVNNSIILALILKLKRTEVLGLLLLHKSVIFHNREF